MERDIKLFAGIAGFMILLFLLLAVSILVADIVDYYQAKEILTLCYENGGENCGRLASWVSI